MATDVEILRQELKDYKEKTDKTLSRLDETTKDQEKRIQVLESEKKKTDYQFEQIMETLTKLNDVTIPNLTKEIEAIKNKPVKRYDQIITASITAIVGGIIGFAISMIFNKG